MVRPARIGAIVLCSLVLPACGGGGGDGTPAPRGAGVEGDTGERAAEAAGIALAASLVVVC
jgi:hypothetical protein